MYNKVQKGLIAAIRIQYFTTIIRTTASIPQKTPYQEHAFESHFSNARQYFSYDAYPSIIRSTIINIHTSVAAPQFGTLSAQ